MQIFKCENCHSVFIVNETDERIMNGNYGVPVQIDCPMCGAELRITPTEQEKASSYFKEAK